MLIVHPAGVISLVTVLRSQVIRVASMKLGQQERDAAIKQTLEYLQGPEFSNSMESIAEEAINAYKELNIEVKRHLEAWRKRYFSYVKIYNEAINVSDSTGVALSGKKAVKSIKSGHSEGDFPHLQDTRVELPLELPKENKQDNTG